MCVFNTFFIAHVSAGSRDDGAHRSCLNVQCRTVSYRYYSITMAPSLLRTALYFAFCLISFKEFTAFAFCPTIRNGCFRAASSSSALGVSELHIPGYVQSKLPFILTGEDLSEEGSTTLSRLDAREYSQDDFESLIPFQSGHLLHKTKEQVLSTEECQRIVQEAETVASRMGWTTSRHGNYPTTDIPLVELPKTLAFLKRALVERIYPLLTAQFGEFLPDASKLRVADGFIVKYDAEGGQTEVSDVVVN